MITFDIPVTLVGGGPFAPADLNAARDIGQIVIAADSGADQALALGVTPELVLGDMDSMVGPLPDHVEIRQITEQDSTDFEKCLLTVDAPLYIGVGFLDGRLDHTLAAMHTLIANVGRRVILIGAEDIVFAAPRAWQANIDPGTRLSLFPLAPCRGVASTGLRWPIDGLAFAAGTRIGTSNEVTNSPVSLAFDAPGMVVILPKTCLSEIVASLRVIPDQAEHKTHQDLRVL